jgi:hypothetical protein
VGTLAAMAGVRRVIPTGASMRLRLLSTLLLAVALATSGSCHTTDTSPDDPAPSTSAAADNAQPLEWVGFHGEVALGADEIHPLIAGLVGADAQAGNFLKDRELSPKVYLKAEAEPATPDQVRISLSFDDDTTPRRLLAVAPGSFQIGQIWVATVDAALAKMKADNDAKAGSGEAFLLEYRTTSTQGGRLSIGVKGDGGQYSIVVDVQTPKTSLLPDQIGRPAESGTPYDTVAGTVWFHMTSDDFAYFVDHAYGKGATSKQNFTDFALVPHEWLRLTVEPHLDQKFVSVGFEVITVDGKRIAVAKAPASVLAGNAFQMLVLQNMATMSDQEKAKPGSSRPWQIPFYYDAPKTGGVVQVIAQGQAAKYSVAYAVESPRHALTDVPFLDYQPVEIPPPSNEDTAKCEQLGDPSIVLAPRGTLDLTFTASDVLKQSKDLQGPLKGTLYCSVFRAEDVTIGGPKKGSSSVQDFTVPDADLSGSSPVTFTTDLLYAGEYQVLCAQDLDGSGGDSKGDPVTLPIGAITVACNKNPAIVEFALLDPGE